MGERTEKESYLSIFHESRKKIAKRVTITMRLTDIIAPVVYGTGRQDVMMPARIPRPVVSEAFAARPLRVHHPGLLAALLVRLIRSSHPAILAGFMCLTVTGPIFGQTHGKSVREQLLFDFGWRFRSEERRVGKEGGARGSR